MAGSAGRAGGWRHWACLAVLAALWLSGCPRGPDVGPAAPGGGATRPAVPAASPPASGPFYVTPAIIEGTHMATARPNGRWREHFNAHASRLLAANADALWFAKGIYLWRYDVKARRVDAFGSVPATAYTVWGHTLADDGRLAVSSEHFTALWTPGTGWERLPQACGEGNPLHLAFDGRGVLWAGMFQRAASWERGRWQPSIKRLGDKFLSVGDGWIEVVGRGNHVWFSRDFQERQTYQHGLPPCEFSGQTFHAGAQTIGVFSRWQGEPGKQGTQTLQCVRLGREEFELLTDGPGAALDLSTGEACVVKPTAEGRWAVQTAAGQAVTELPPAPAAETAPFNAFLLLLRDANGHYWYGCQRYDGRVWQAFLPANAFYFAGRTEQALAAGRLRYDAKSDVWQDAWPEAPQQIEGYDPKERVGWLRQEKVVAYGRPRTFDLVRIKPDGAREPVCSATIPMQLYEVEYPPQRAAQGDWWFGTRCRWDGKQVHQYDDGTIPGKGGQAHPAIVLSPAGGVWRYNARGEWEVFDRAADKFVPGAPFGDFAFTFAGGTLACLGKHGPPGLESGRAGSLYRQTPEGKWQPLYAPALGRDWLGTRPEPADNAYPLYGQSGRLTRGDRLLLSYDWGVYEWDARTDRWAHLAPKRYDACFDEQGRRVLTSTYQIMVYEGEPVRAPGAELKTVEGRLAELLKLMDNDTWRVRAAASEEAVNLLRRSPLPAARYLSERLRAGQLSPEVRNRVQVVLEDKPLAPTQMPHVVKTIAWRRHVGNSLFERMRQMLAPTFPDGYVIRPGMDWELAQAIFRAAGANRASAGGGQAFLLPDKTKAYLTLEERDGRQHVAKLGLGQAGKGDDPDWDWNDFGERAVQKLELAPYADTISSQPPGT